VEQTSIFVSQGTENLRKASSYRVGTSVIPWRSPLNNITCISEQSAQEEADPGGHPERRAVGHHLDTGLSVQELSRFRIIQTKLVNCCEKTRVAACRPLTPVIPHPLLWTLGEIVALVLKPTSNIGLKSRNSKAKIECFLEYSPARAYVIFALKIIFYFICTTFIITHPVYWLWLTTVGCKF